MGNEIADSIRRYRNPDKLLYDLGIDDPREINIEAIAEHCNASIRYEHLNGYSGLIIGTSDRAKIIVDSKSQQPRQRFTAAHELGHWFFDRGKIFLCTEEMLNSNWLGYFGQKEEIRANRYAAELLMPDSLFKPHACNKPITFDTIRNLAPLFNTSLTATAIRLVETGSLPGMVICFKNGKKAWFKRGPAIEESNLWPVDRLDNRTAAYNMQKNNSENSTSAETPADYWITHERSNEYYVNEDSISVGQDLILTLLWWKDEKQLIDLCDYDEATDDLCTNPPCFK